MVRFTKLVTAALVTSMLAAVSVDSYAQTRRSGSTTTTSSSSKSSSASRSSSSTSSRTSSSSATPSRSTSATSTTTVTRSSDSSVKSGTSTGTVTRTTPSNQDVNKKSTTSQRTNSQQSATTTQRTGAASTTTQRATTTAAPSSSARQVTQSKPSNTSSVQAGAPSTQIRATSAGRGERQTGLTTAGPSNKTNISTNSNIRLGNDDRRDVLRVHPRERDFRDHASISRFYYNEPHYFGYRITTLPTRYRRIHHWGHDYYYCDGIFYRYHNNHYYVSRPYYGYVIDARIRDMYYSTVRFSYYHNVYRTFNIIDDNYAIIMSQNREIAKNNALLASQNRSIALNSSRALSAYEIANALGLMQSFANANKEYYYEDGVFFMANRAGRYEVIVPPAGALVASLPDDYDTIVLNGVEYYRVDDTVYRLVLEDGTPLLEVLGQMPGSMYSRYNY